MFAHLTVLFSIHLSKSNRIQALIEKCRHYLSGQIRTFINVVLIQKLLVLVAEVQFVKELDRPFCSHCKHHILGGCSQWNGFVKSKTLALGVLIIFG